MHSQTQRVLFPWNKWNKFVNKMSITRIFITQAYSRINDWTLLSKISRSIGLLCLEQRILLIHSDRFIRYELSVRISFVYFRFWWFFHSFFLLFRFSGLFRFTCQGNVLELIFWILFLMTVRQTFVKVRTCTNHIRVFIPFTVVFLAFDDIIFFFSSLARFIKVARTFQMQ